MEEACESRHTVSSSSELFLEILGPKTVGGLLLPILGALHDPMLIRGLNGKSWLALNTLVLHFHPCMRFSRARFENPPRSVVDAGNTGSSAEAIDRSKHSPGSPANDPHVTIFLFKASLCKSLSSWDNDLGNSDLHEIKNVAISPHISPNVDPQPLYPLQTPTPLMPFTHNRAPKLSGFCSFNFSAVENILWVTATDCWASLAPYLANVVCCPQADSSLVILIGQSSIHTQKLALSETEARHCISDFQQIMESKGASESLLEICSVHPSNLTQLSCPVSDANEIERKIDSSALLDACEKIDPTNECCNQVCQNAISDAAEELAVRNYTRIVLGSTSVVYEHLSLLNDCKNIVLRWLASKLDPTSANRVLRVLTSCKINEGK
ncbi:putative GPI-anchored protein-like [Forsythia ovata]|uniref:GPI-anchored protein-like n=1 Tax=Forsythia ovata TaxID=205694 RepID=A0ABD1QE90_9LAMI